MSVKFVPADKTLSPQGVLRTILVALDASISFVIDEHEPFEYDAGHITNMTAGTNFPCDIFVERI